MANLSAAIQQVRRTRRELDVPMSENFDRYRPEYEVILSAVADLAGDAAFDELKLWLIETTKENQKLPSPDAVRKRAREICTTRGVSIPRDSSLRN